MKNFDKAVQEYEKLWISNYDCGVKRHLSPSESTLKDILLELCETQPQEPHIIYKGRTWTYGESNTIACKLGNVLQKMGNRKSDCVAMVLPNIPETIFAYMACYKTGLVTAGVNPRYTVTEIRRCLQTCEAKTVIVWEDDLEKLNEIRMSEDCTVRNIIVVKSSDAPDPSQSMIEFYDLIENENDNEPEAEVGIYDMQSLAFTGGTTGLFKGCCYTNEMIVRHSNAWANWFSPLFPDKKKIRLLACLPMTHAYAMTTSINLPLMSGGSVILNESPDTETIIGEIEQWKPNLWPTVPALLTRLATQPELCGRTLDSLKLILFGSAPPQPETVRALKELTSAHLSEGYGLSEAVSCVSFMPYEKGDRIGPVGLPISDTDVLIVDLEDGEELVPLGKQGEIIFRGPQRIEQYLNQPKETADAIRNGWFYTGDIGYMDEEGFLYVVDRKKDIVNVGGFNVFPSEVDEVIQGISEVFECCTVGVKHKTLGEAVVSFVVFTSGKTLSEQKIIDHCRTKLTGYKVPRKVIAIPAVPRTLLNKPDRLEMRRLASKEFDTD